MDNPIYAWVYNDPFHPIFVAVTTGLSLLSNSFLVCITSTAAAEHLGSYRYLLAVFAVCDITTSLGHAGLQPYVHLTSAGFYFFPRYAGMMPADTTFCLLFIATYYQTFLVLAYHFVYRYKTVTRHDLSGLGSRLGSSWSTAQWCAAALVVYILYISIYVITVAVGMIPSDEIRAAVPSEIFTIYGINLTDTRTGFTVLALRRRDRLTGEEFWSAESSVSLAICVALFAGTAAVILFCTYRTVVTIKSSDAILSTPTRRMHRQLFRALLIQTAVPCVFSYSPLAVCLLWPITGISLGALGNVLYLTTAIFPSIDAFFVLFFIKKFRLAVIRMFRLPIPTSVGGSSAEQRSGVQITF